MLLAFMPSSAAICKSQRFVFHGRELESLEPSIVSPFPLALTRHSRPCREAYEGIFLIPERCT